MTKFRLGVIGAGMGAKPHGQALNELHHLIEVAGVYTRSEASRRNFCQDHNLPEAKDLDALIGDPTVDGILLLTPPNARDAIIRACATAGKHVLCEKPLERTSDAAADLVRVCDAAGVRLGVVFQHRYRKASQDLARILGDGRLGPICAVRVEVPWWRDQAYYDVPGRGSYERDGGGVLISQAIHTLDLMLSLTGPVASVQAMAATTALHQMESEDFVSAGLRFANGAVGSLFASTAAYPGDTESIRLDCAKGSVLLKAGTLSIDWQGGHSEVRGATAGTGGGADPMAFPCDWHRDLIAGFVSAVREDRDPTPSGRDALAVQSLIAALIRSSREGQQVSLSTPHLAQ